MSFHLQQSFFVGVYRMSWIFLFLFSPCPFFLCPGFFILSLLSLFAYFHLFSIVVTVRHRWVFECFTFYAFFLKSFCVESSSPSSCSYQILFFPLSLVQEKTFSILKVSILVLVWPRILELPLMPPTPISELNSTGFLLIWKLETKMK